MTYGLCLIGGAFIGTFLGMAVMACCIAASEADDWNDRH